MVGEDETWTRNIRRHCKTARVLLQYYRPTFLNAGRPPCFISLGPIKMLLGLRGGNSIDSKNPTQNPAMVLKLYTPKARFNAEMFFFWGYIKSIFWLFKAAKPCYLSDSSCRVVLQSYKVVASSAGFLMTLAAEYFCQNELAPSGKRDMINPGIAPISPSPSFLPSFLSLVLVSVRYPAERLRSFIYSCPASFILRPTEPTKEDPVRIALRRLRKEMEGLFLVSLHVKGPPWPFGGHVYSNLKSNISTTVHFFAPESFAPWSRPRRYPRRFSATIILRSYSGYFERKP